LDILKAVLPLDVKAMIALDLEIDDTWIGIKGIGIKGIEIKGKGVKWVGVKG
jgi:hypothetical protein